MYSEQMTIPDALERAIAFHRAGKLQDAEKLYRAILHADPCHPDANHNLGVLAVLENNFEAGLSHLKAAVEAMPSQGHYWLSYVDTLIKAGRGETAINVITQGRGIGLGGEVVDRLEVLARKLAREGSEQQTVPSLSSVDFTQLIALRETGKYNDSLEWLDRHIEAHLDDAEAYAHRAHILLQLRREVEAHEAVQKACALNLALPVVQRNLTRVLLTQNKFGEALIAAHTAYQANPADPENQLVLAAALGANKDITKATKLIVSALQAKPYYAEAYVQRGIFKFQEGDAPGALSDMQQALSIKPHLSRIWCFVSMLQEKLDNQKAAITAAKKALEYDPDNVQFMTILGELCRKSGEEQEAIALLFRAVTIAPADANAWTNYGTVLQQAHHQDEAREAYRKALAINPNNAEVANNLGAMAKDDGTWEDALKYFETALSIQPDNITAQVNKAISLAKLGREAEAHDLLARSIAKYGDESELLQAMARLYIYQENWAEAEAWAQRAVAEAPDKWEPEILLAEILTTQSKPELAFKHYERAFTINSEKPIEFINACTVLPIICQSKEDILSWRSAYLSALTSIKGNVDTNFSYDRLGSLTFHLAYHGISNLHLNKMVHDFFCNSFPTVFNKKIPSRVKYFSKTMRVGFISRYFTNHTIGKLYANLIRNIDNDKFEVVVIHTSETKNGSLKDEIDSYADSVITLPASLDKMQTIVGKQDFDILFYPDIGMDRATYFLAYFRLAPVQIVSWGHPDTTGIDTIDYFLSADCIEPLEADSHYTERLIRMNRLPCYYQPIVVPTMTPSRSAYGLPEEKTLYGCPQSLFKFHPDFDPVLERIAQGDPNGRIVIIEGQHDNWTTLLRKRLQKYAPTADKQLIVLPRMSNTRFMSLLAHMDVLLDPVHFGSGNTLYESFVYGIPIVTWPGEFARGRLVAGAYRQIGIPDPPIASSMEEYAELALDLGRNKERRDAIKISLISMDKGKLYEDMRAVRELEIFFQAAVEAARRGEKLPSGWRPSGENGFADCSERDKT